MRFVKQMIYGIFYLAVLSGVGFLLYTSNIIIAPTCLDGRLNQGEEEVDCGGPNCGSCELKHLQEIRSSVQYFPIGTNTNVVTIFSNPNLNYGATFTYAVDFYDINRNKLYSLSKDAFIYSAEAQRVIVEPNLPFSSGPVFGSPEISLSQIEWKAKEEFKAPLIQLRQINTTISGSRATVSGIVANRESTDLAEVSVGALVTRKSNRAPVGASKTILQALKPFEERAFTISVPLTTTLKIAEIESIIYTAAKR